MGKELNYKLQARVFPALLVSIPALILYYFTLGTKLNDLIGFIGKAELVANVSISAAIVFLVIQLNRFLSKELFQKEFFSGEEDMPTTRYLLHQDDYLPAAIKTSIHSKIFQDFNIRIKSLDEEKENEKEARKTIVMAVSQIREKLRGNQMVLRHNIEYGFVRNLLGGCILAIVISIINMIIFRFFIFSELAYFISLITLILFSIPIFARKRIIQHYGHSYGKILLEQYNNS